MFTLSAQARNARRAGLFSCATLFAMLLLAATSHAQIGGIDPDPGDRGTGGRNTIQGNVYFPSGTRVDKRLRVRLSGIRGGMTTLTDDNGAFSFRRLGKGSYTVTVEAGKEYQPVNESVDIYESSRVVTLQIQLRLRGAEANPKPAVVSAALANVPKAALELYTKALKSAQDGDSAKAIEQLNRSLAIYPQFMLAFNELGVDYLRLGQYDKASEALHSALKIDPEAFTPRLNLGILLVQKKQFAEAAAELDRASKKNGDSALAHLYMGRARIGLREMDKAEKELQQSVKIGGNDSIMAHKYLGGVYRQRGESALAVSELETYLRLAPQDKDADAIRQIIKQLREQPASTKK